ncbi:MAG TPA: hypothetical protein VF583_08035, partial [Bradyrhizobium sp.]
MTGGNCKLQWRVDWAMRWTALGVDYEMSGKDLIDSVKLGSQICRALGGRPPENFTYELFLDEKGEKISKSKGNGLTVDEWLSYGPPESLSLFMFNSPKSAKRLHFDVIPRQVDDYLTFIGKFPEQAPKDGDAQPTQQLDNPVWHIHAGKPPAPEPDGLPFNILLNLVGVANTEDKAVLWGFISRYAPKASPQNNPFLDKLVGYAINYFRDYVKPTRRFRAPTEQERAALGGTPPEGFNYELFLDEKGQKISKSKGNGLTIDEWLRYASPESLSLFMYREPKAAKRLYFDVIPRNVDDYQQFLDGFTRQEPRQQLQNPVWHIHSGKPPQADMPVTFQLLLTLVSSSNAENAETLWGFIGRYRPGVTPQTHPKLDAMVGYAINYYRDFVAPTKQFREPTEAERAALQDLRDALANMPADATAEDIQNVVYEIGRREPFLDLVKKGKDGRPGVSLDWFNMLYQVLLGQEKGPRFGSFVAVYGVQNAVNMIDGALARSS